MGLATIVFLCIFILVSLEKKNDLLKNLEKSGLMLAHRMVA